MCQHNGIDVLITCMPKGQRLIRQILDDRMRYLSKPIYISIYGVPLVPDFYALFIGRQYVGLPPFPVTITPAVGHLVTICSRSSSNLLQKELHVWDILNPTELSKHSFWVIGFDNVDALYKAAEKANGIKWMTVSGTWYGFACRFSKDALADPRIST